MASEGREGWQGIVSELRKGIVPFIFAAIGGLVVAVPTYLTSNRQMDVKMVEIAVNILGQKPEPNIQPARFWAVDVIKAYSKVPLPPEVQAALIENRALAAYNSYDLYDFAPFPSGTGSAAAASIPAPALREPSKPQ